MNVFQKKAHTDAMNRTIAYFKEVGTTVTQTQIGKVLAIVHIYIVHLSNTVHRRKKKNYASVSKVGIGYFRVIYPKLFDDMHKTGEFTDQEFNVIRNEFYKKEFDIYYKLIKQQQVWKQQRLKQAKDN